VHMISYYSYLRPNTPHY